MFLKRVESLVPLMYNSVELGRLETICVLRKDYYEAVRSPVEVASVLGQHVPANIITHLPLQVPVRRDGTVKRLPDGRPSRMGLYPQTGDVGSHTVGPVNVNDFRLGTTRARHVVDLYFKSHRARDRLRQEDARGLVTPTGDGGPQAGTLLLALPTVIESAPPIPAPTGKAQSGPAHREAKGCRQREPSCRRRPKLAPMLDCLVYHPRRGRPKNLLKMMLWFRRLLPFLPRRPLLPG